MLRVQEKYVRLRFACNTIKVVEDFRLDALLLGIKDDVVVDVDGFATLPLSA